MDIGIGVELLRLSKKDVAKSHIDSAIDLVLGAKGWSSAHLLAWAAQHVLKGVARVSSTATFRTELGDWAAPGFEKQFWHAVDAHYNFFKHADHDANLKIENYDPRATAWGLWMACHDYRKVYRTLTWSMLVYQNWFYCWRPEITCGPLTELAEKLRDSLGFPEGKPIDEAVRCANDLLQHGRRHPDEFKRALGSNWESAIEWDHC